MGRSYLALLALSLCSLATSSAKAAPQSVFYQGELSDAFGNPVDTAVDMTFTIYDAETGGIIKWSETQIAVPVVTGVFTVYLGDVTTLLPSVFTGAGNRYLGVKVGSDAEMVPRSLIAAVPSAMRAGIAEDVVDTSITESKLRNKSITRGKINDKAVGKGQLGDTAVGRGQLNDKAVGRGQLGDTAVGRSKLGDKAVGHGQLDDNSVDGNNIMDGTIMFSDLAQNGAASGEVLKWNGSAWMAGSDNIGSVDADWSLTGNVIYSGGQWGIARNGATLHGIHDSTHTNLGVASQTGMTGQDFKYSTVGGGFFNRALGEFGTISGGQLNFAVGEHSTVSGGKQNYAGSPYSTIGGGLNNSANDTGTVSGGVQNFADAAAATVGGGAQDTASGLNSTVSGGRRNHAFSESSTIAGGVLNVAQGKASSIGGGEQNLTQNSFANISGGMNNSAKAGWSTIGGGRFNSVQTGSDYSTVSGGELNMSLGNHSTIGGGENNIILGLGVEGTICGGQSNRVEANHATVCGGNNNTASGSYSFAAGKNARAQHDGSFVWANATVFNTVSSAADGQFVVSAPGGIWLGDDNSVTAQPGRFIETSTGAYLTNSGSWTNASDEALKENFTTVDGEELLSKIEELPIRRWNYKLDNDNVQHIGPMAQDFKKAFNVGSDDKSISTIDPSGIALAAIQQLHKQNKQLMIQLNDQAKIIEEMKRQLEQLARRVPK